MKLSIVTSIWGEWHTQQFAELVMPALLHESNLPALCAMHECSWTIHTRPEDASLLKHLMRPVRDMLSVRVIADEENKERMYRIGWLKGHFEAFRAGALAMFLPPDVLWSTGSMRHFAELIENGHRSIFVAHPRAVPSLFEGRPSVAREMLRLAFSENHPVNLSHEVDSEHFSRHPEMMIWSVEHAKVVRMFAREAFVCDPHEVAFDETGLPDEVGTNPIVVSSSDDALGVSLAPLLHDHHQYKRRNFCRLEKLRQWMNGYTSPTVPWLSRQHSVWMAGPASESSIAGAVAESMRFVESVFAEEHATA